MILRSAITLIILFTISISFFETAHNKNVRTAKETIKKFESKKINQEQAMGMLNEAFNEECARQQKEGFSGNALEEINNTTFLFEQSVGICSIEETRPLNFLRESSPEDCRNSSLWDRFCFKGDLR